MPNEAKDDGVTLPPIPSAKKESDEGDEEAKGEQTETPEAQELVPKPPEKPNPKAAASVDDTKPSSEPEPSASSTAPIARPKAGNVTHKPAASAEGEPIAPTAPPAKGKLLIGGLEREGEDLTHSKSCTVLRSGGGEATQNGTHEESKGEIENKDERKDINRSTSEGELAVEVDVSTWGKTPEGKKGENDGSEKGSEKSGSEGGDDADDAGEKQKLIETAQKKLQEELTRIAEENDILAQKHDSLLIDDLDRDFNGIYEYAGERNGHPIYKLEENELSWFDRWCLCHKGVQVFHRDAHHCWHKHVKFTISSVPFTTK